MKLKIVVFGICAIFIMVSCADFVNVDQPDIIEQEQAFSDKNSTRLAINGIYGLMTELVEPMFLAGEVRADLTISNASAVSDIKEFSNNSFSASNQYISPKPFYTIINNTIDFNNVFEGMYERLEMDTIDYLKYTAELTAIRVWSQYQIAKIFGKCKYYTEDLNSDSLVIEEYAFEDTTFLGILIRDLTYADTLSFSTSSDPVKWQTIRLSDYYVNVLMGELYMDKGEYEKADKKFTEVLAYGDIKNRITRRFKSKTAFDDGYDWYRSLFYLDWEIAGLLDNAVFMIGFEDKYNQSNNLKSWTLSLDYQVEPAEWYVNEFFKNSNWGEMESDGRYLSVLNVTDFRKDYVISKYQEVDRPFIMSRTARIVLLKAYCYNAIGNTKKAVNEYNTIRKRVKFSTLNEDEMPSDDNQAKLWLEDKIIDELAYETGFEGQRWFDLMRVAIRRNDDTYIAKKVSQKYPLASREKIYNKLSDRTNWYVPIFE